MYRLMLFGLIAGLGIGCASTPMAALSPASSWSEIRSTPSVLAQAPLIFFGTTGVSVLDLCHRGDRIERLGALDMGSEVSATSVRREYDISVVYVVGAGTEHSHYRYLFTKHHEIPACP